VNDSPHAVTGSDGIGTTGLRIAGEARTWLFVPGDRPDRFAKARSSGAHEIILDLEDAITPDRKTRARRDVEWWLSHGGSGWVRINSVETDWYGDDVNMLSQLGGLRGFIVPKAEVPAALQLLGRRLQHRGLIPLIETAAGIHRAHQIAETEAVDRLAFGSIDYAADINADETRDSLLLARNTLVLASRIANKPAPIDGVVTTFTDPGAIFEAAAYSRQLGFGGKLCIHPAQLGPMCAAFAPSTEEVQWAQRTIRAAEASGSGASAANGQMIDKPILERARRVVHEAATLAMI
jgi:citrate lyase subunit beta / citryl-CoA lyase